MLFDWTYEKPAACPSWGLLNNSISTDFSPKVNSRKRAVTLQRQSRDGLFSWNKSPANRTKSTLKQIKLICFFKITLIVRNQPYIILDCQLQDLLECVNRILTSYWISFHITNMVIRREQYPYRIIVVFKICSVSGSHETLQSIERKTNIPVQRCLYAEEEFLRPHLTLYFKLQQ